MTNRFLWLLVSFPLCLKAQTRILELPPYGSTLDSMRNHGHIVIEKLPADSAWMVYEYDTQDSIMTIGTFKDEKLTIPNGKFKYYQYRPSRLEITYDYTLHKADSVIVPAKNSIRTVGYYFNGEKTGIWTTFDDFSKKITDEIFEHGKLNGLYQSYNSNTGKVFISGNYVDDMREGNWNMLSFEGDTMSTDVYKHNKVVKTISYLNEKKIKDKTVTNAHRNYNFIRYLNAQISKKGISQSGTKRSLYMFTIDKTGHIVAPTVITNGNINADVSLEVDRAIIDAMLNAPPWVPGEQNKQMVKISTSLQLNITFDKKGISVSQASYPANYARKNAFSTFNGLNDGGDQHINVQ